MLTLNRRGCWTKRQSRPVSHREISTPSNDVALGLERWDMSGLKGPSSGPEWGAGGDFARVVLAPAPPQLPKLVFQRLPRRLFFPQMVLRLP